MKRILFVACLTIIAILIARSAARGTIHICNATPNAITVGIVTQQLEPKPTHGIYYGAYTIAAGVCSVPLALSHQMGAVFMRYEEHSQDSTWLASSPVQDFEIAGQFESFHRIDQSRPDTTVVLLASDASVVF